MLNCVYIFVTIRINCKGYFFFYCFNVKDIRFEILKWGFHFRIFKDICDLSVIFICHQVDEYLSGLYPSSYNKSMLLPN
jgi:hypothetical protein